MRRPQLTPGAYRRVTFIALLALVGIIVTGASVRLTGSGLGCPDWPTCEDDRLVAPLRYHAMVEFVNRTITGLVSIAVILAVLGALVRVPRRRDLVWWSFGLVAGVVGQIFLGGLTVLWELTPPIVAAHFLLSMVLVWNAVVLHDRAGQRDADRPAASTPSVGGPRPLGRPAGLRPLGRPAGLLVALASVVLVAGTVVTGAGPHGGDEEVERLDLSIRAAAQIHGITVMVLLAATLYLARLVFTRLPAGAPAHDELRWRIEVLLAVIVGQGAVGYTQYFLDVPKVLVALHIIGSVAVWVAVLRVYLGLGRLRSGGIEEGEGGVDELEVLRRGEVVDTAKGHELGVR